MLSHSWGRGWEMWALLHGQFCPPRIRDGAASGAPLLSWMLWWLAGAVSPARFASLLTKAGGTPAFMGRRIGTRRNYTTDIQTDLKVLFQPLLGLRRSLIKAASFLFTIM